MLELTDGEIRRPCRLMPLKPFYPHSNMSRKNHIYVISPIPNSQSRNSLDVCPDPFHHIGFLLWCYSTSDDHFWDFCQTDKLWKNKNSKSCKNYLLQEKRIFFNLVKSFTCDDQGVVFQGSVSIQFLFNLWKVISEINSNQLTFTNLSLSYEPTVAESSPSISISFSLIDSSLQEYPMLIAVSTLSPVRTHTFMSAFFIISMVSATWSWSLSSIAVTPRN